MLGETRSRRGGRLRLMGVAAAVGLAAVGALATFRAGGAPRIEISADRPGIGRLTRIQVALSEPRRGLTRTRVELVQGERVTSLAESEHAPRPSWSLWGERTEREELTFEVGSAVTEGLRAGEATVRVTSHPASTWLRSPAAAVEELTLPVRLQPPSLAVLSGQNYVAQGGSAAVVYRVGEAAVRDGVCVGAWRFPGYPMEAPGASPGTRFSLFGVPFDHEDPHDIRLCAEDELGNEARAPFVDQFFPRPYRRDDIEVDDDFLARVVPAIVTSTPGLEGGAGLLETYLIINRDLRRENNEELRRVAEASRADFPWTDPFLPMPNAQVMSSFADRRTYHYRGREVDRQDHLGFDLASVRHAPVPASNRGVVALARYLGIYGNTVVLDHGHGLMTLYGHLSSMDVEEGQQVERGATLGRTGVTGLAGGDHLHFTTLVHGLPVTPVEWWDARWIRDRVASKLAGVLHFAG